MQLIPYTSRTTSEHYSPWDQLPAPVPAESTYLSRHFYENTAKHLIKDTVRIMSNGLGIDLVKVEALEHSLEETISDIEAKLATNPIVKSFLESKYSRLMEIKLAAKNASNYSKLRTVESFILEFKPKDKVHRSYFMYLYAQSQGITQPKELLPGFIIPKWDAKLVKTLATTRPLLQRLLDGSLTSHPIITEAMTLLATHKAELHNRKYQPVTSVEVDLPKFNPRSSDDKHALLTDLLGYKSGTLTDAYESYERDLDKHIKYGKPEPTEPKNKWSWGRSELVELQPTLTNPDEIELFQCLIDFSFGDKIKTSYIPAFYKYTVDGRLYSNLKLLGAKSGRFTSNNPNMLQLPSSGSIYAKPVKKCFVAPEGHVIFTVDLNALEDRVLASITLDEGKCSLLEDETLDGHCYNCLGYYYDKVVQYLDPDLSFIDQARQFKQLVDNKHKELKSLRQDSKAVTFKLAYLGGVDSDRGGAITPEIYHSYHNVLYPKVREYIDDYVIPTANSEGRIHLGLGFYLLTDNALKDQRTLHNAINISNFKNCML